MTTFFHFPDVFYSKMWITLSFFWKFAHCVWLLAHSQPVVGRLVEFNNIIDPADNLYFPIKCRFQKRLSIALLYHLNAFLLKKKIDLCMICIQFIGQWTTYSLFHWRWQTDEWAIWRLLDDYTCIILNCPPQTRALSTQPNKEVNR